jgi:putative transposase
VAEGDRRVRRGGPALASTRVADAKPGFTRRFNACGVPQRLRPATGVPFATKTLGRLSHLSAWWVRLGSFPAGLEPGTPQQTGRHARMHRTLKAEPTRPPARPRRAPPRQLDRFREACNGQRPHEALDRHPPASCDDPAPRQRPHSLPPRDYPDRFEVRDVRATGGLRWHHPWSNVSHPCIGDYGGLADLDDGIRKVSCGPLTLGRRRERPRRIEEAYGRLTRHR